MTLERWQQIKNLVNSAMAEDAATRSAVLQQSLAEACADDLPMRRGAEALLSFHEEATRRSANAPAIAAPISPDRWRRIEQIFQSALELDHTKRSAYLDEACGEDAALRHEVESLLVYQAVAGGLIQGAIHEAAGLLTDSAAEKARFTPGTTLNKRYRIIGRLGKGGMGEVYRADDLKLELPVALKFLTEKLSQDQAMLKQFHSEAAMALRVTHPNVCRVRDIGEVTTSTGKLHFLSMEYVDGEDLSSLLRRIGRLHADKAVEIANQLCAGLAAAHEAGVLHRDLKPANVMLDGKGCVRITDFGLAGLAEQIRGKEVFAGTPAYMSPEQFAGKEATTSSDIYALGLVLYEIFTGKQVFEASSLDEFQRLHESSSPTNPSNWVKDIDPSVERAILRCLEKDPANRLASAKQVADALSGSDPLPAGEKTGMRPLYAVLCLLAIFAGLFIYAKLAPKVFVLGRVPLKSSPEALAVKAREISKQLGYAERPLDSVCGIGEDSSYYKHIEKSAHWPNRWQLLEGGRGSTIIIGCRESPAPLVSNEHTKSPDYTSPPWDVPGMVGVQLDSQGRLIGFQAKPQDYEKNATAKPNGKLPSAAQPVAVDWKQLFTLAGLDQSRFILVEPEWNPAFAYDTRVAYKGTAEEMPDVPLRVEAASYSGKIVFFKIIYPWTKPFAQDAAPNLWLLIPASMIFISVVLVGLLARHNLRKGKGNRKRALRLAVFVSCGRLLALLFLAKHSIFSGEVGDEADFLVRSAGDSLLIGLFAWLLYLATEPFIRKRWPQSLVSWNRVIDGQFNNPLVGRDILLGLLAGILLHLVFIFVDFQQDTLNRLRGLFELQSLRFTISAFLNDLLTMVQVALVFIFWGALLRPRRAWRVWALLILIITAVGIIRNGLTAMMLSPIGLLPVIYVSSRFGLLTLNAALLMGSCLFVLQAPWDLSAWYASSTLFMLGTILALALFAFYTSLGGQKVFEGKLLEE